MKKPSPTFTWDVVDSLRTAAGIADDPIPEGAFTAQDYAERYGATHRNASVQCERLAAQGRLARGKRHSGPSNRMKVFYWVP